MAATDQGSPVGRGEGFRGSAPVLTAPAQSSPSRLHTQEALRRVSARPSPPLQGAPGCSDQRLRSHLLLVCCQGQTHPYRHHPLAPVEAGGGEQFDVPRRSLQKTKGRFCQSKQRETFLVGSSQAQHPSQSHAVPRGSLFRDVASCDFLH